MKVNISKLFCFLFPWMFILNGYKSFLPGMTLGATLFVGMGVIAFFICIVNKGISLKFSRYYPIIFLWISFLMISFIDFLRLGVINTNELLVYCLKTGSFMLGVIFLNEGFLDFKKVSNTFIKASFVFTCYFYLQFFLWITVGYFLPNLFDVGPFTPMYDGYGADGYLEYITRLGMARPASFFSEPSFYADLCVEAVALLLFRVYDLEIIEKLRGILMVFFSGACILSTSTSGIVLLGLLLLGYAVLHSGRSISKAIVSFVSTFIVLLIILYLLQEFYPSLYNFTITKLLNVQESGRVGNALKIISKLGGLDLWIGVGAGNSSIFFGETYLNAASGILISFGIVGFVLFVMTYFLYGQRLCNYSTLLLILYFIKICQSGALYNLYGFLTVVVIRFVNDSYNERRYLKDIASRHEVKCNI